MWWFVKSLNRSKARVARFCWMNLNSVWDDAKCLTRDARTCTVHTSAPNVHRKYPAAYIAWFTTLCLNTTLQCMTSFPHSASYASTLSIRPSYRCLHTIRGYRRTGKQVNQMPLPFANRGGFSWEHPSATGIYRCSIIRLCHIPNAVGNTEHCGIPFSSPIQQAYN